MNGMSRSGTDWDSREHMARAGGGSPRAVTLVLAAAVALMAGCGASSSPTATGGPSTTSGNPTASTSPSVSPVPTASPSQTVPAVVWTTVTLQGTPTVTVSIPPGWVPQPVVGDGSSVTVEGPSGAVIRFGHPTAGSWTATTCEQQAPREVPDYVASGSEPITIDGLATTEYSVADMMLVSYSAGTYLSNGSCWWAT